MARLAADEDSSGDSYDFPEHESEFGFLQNDLEFGGPPQPVYVPRRRLQLLDEEKPEIRSLLGIVHQVNDSNADTALRRLALENLSFALRPECLEPQDRREFVRRAMESGVVKQAVELIERGSVDLATAAANFLGDFAFNSDMGAQAVLKVFSRIADRFQHIFGAHAWDHLPLLDAAILLCVNIAATCPSGHARLVPLVQPVCLQILRNSRVSDKLRGNTILLLANLSMTVRQELRSLQVAKVLLDLVEADHVPATGKSVAESVIIFLHGDRRCYEVDRLIEAGIVSEYCVPIMELTLRGKEFRGMYPHLLYSARLFQMLAQSWEYAEALVKDHRVVPLLLEANRAVGRPHRVETDFEGRSLVLEALLSLARFKLWPRPGDEVSATFLEHDLPKLLGEDHVLIRRAATDLWALLNPCCVLELLLVGHRLEADGWLPCGLWKRKVAACLYPFLAGAASF